MLGCCRLMVSMMMMMVKSRKGAWDICGDEVETASILATRYSPCRPSEHGERWDEHGGAGKAPIGFSSL